VPIGERKRQKLIVVAPADEDLAVAVRTGHDSFPSFAFPQSEHAGILGRKSLPRRSTFADMLR
jgi:hypothetical protein